MKHSTESFLHLLHEVKSKNLSEYEQRMIENFEAIYKDYIVQGKELELLTYMGNKIQQLLKKTE